MVSEELQAIHKCYDVLKTKIIRKTIERIQNDYEHCDLRQDEFILKKDWIKTDMYRMVDIELMDFKNTIEMYVQSGEESLIDNIIDELKKENFVIEG